MPGLSTDCKLQRTGRSTDRFSTDPDLHTGTPTDQDQEKKKTDLALCVPLYPPWLLAPPSFQLLREASRREALPTSNALTPPLAAHGGRGKRCAGPPGSMCPRDFHPPKSGPHPTSPLTSGSNDPPPYQSAGKAGGKIRAPSELLLIPHGVIGIPSSFSLEETVLEAERVVVWLLVVGIVVEVMRMAWLVERRVWLWWWKGGGSEAVV